jgi:hypothetical protein
VTPIKRAVVAGHICLDIIPGLGNLRAGQFISLLQPGHLVNIGEAQLSTGGPGWPYTRLASLPGWRQR